MSGKGKEKDSSKEKELNEQQEIVAQFQRLREQQQAIVADLSRMEEQSREHERVLEVLNTLEPDRKCYRLYGDDLIEHSVQEVSPLIKQNIENFGKLATMLNERLVAKGKELNDYKAKHNIRILTDKEAAELRSAKLMTATKK